MANHPKNLLTPKQVAQAIGVSESSLKRWCDKGLLAMSKTAGGHRRLQMASVMQFVRRTRQPLERPELLGLPAATAQNPTTCQRAAEQALEAFVEGDECLCRRLVLDLFLSGHHTADICDKILTPVFRGMGAGWEHGQVEVYEERRAVEICSRILFELRGLLPPVPAGAPYAFGGTLSGDPYKLPTAMVELVLRELGWRADSYGVDLPADTLSAALRNARPTLFWLSVSAIATPEGFVEHYRQVSATAIATGTAIIVGGRALDDGIRQEIQYSAFGDNLRHLVGFAETLHAAPGLATP